MTQFMTALVGTSSGTLTRQEETFLRFTMKGRKMAENVFFPVFYDSKELTDLLDDSQYRKLFEALYDYAIGGKELVSDDRLLTMAYLSMRSQIRRVYDQAEAKASAARSRWKKGHDDPEHDDPADAEKKCMSTKNVHMQNDGADAENSSHNPIQSNPVNPIQSNPIQRERARPASRPPPALQGRPTDLIRTYSSAMRTAPSSCRKGRATQTP